MTPIRVCNVDEEGRFGGPERRIVLVAKALKALGVETHVVYPRLDSERFATELRKAMVAGSALNITRLSKEKKVAARYLLRFLAEIYQLGEFFRKHDFNLIHVNGSYQFKVALSARMVGIPFIWHLNDTSMDSVVKKGCISIAKNWAAGLIFASNRVYDYYIRGTPLEQIASFEIQAPVDTSIFDPNRTDPDPRVSGATGRKIVTVSGINPTKGLEYFIEMAASLQQRYDDLSFFVAGAEFSSQRRYYKYLKDLIVSCKLSIQNFTFTGMLEDVPSFLCGADIFVLTSVSEASPSAVWEAMAMGRAIVATDVGSVSQYIENGKSGFVVPVKDVRALREKVGVLLDNPVLRQEMGTKARQVALDNLDVTVIARRHAFFYRKILASSSTTNKDSNEGWDII